MVAKIMEGESTMHGMKITLPGKVPPDTDISQEKRPDGLTKEEGKVMDALITAWKTFVSLDRQHPDEQRDFADGIHKCQDLLAVRIARREYPEGWPIKK